MDDYSCKSEHSAMGKEAATEADMSLSHKVEVPALSMDTSSQAIVEEGRLESNPINVSPTAAAYNSCSESPMADLTELLGDANLAANHMLSIKRSMDLQQQIR